MKPPAPPGLRRALAFIALLITAACAQITPMPEPTTAPEPVLLAVRLPAELDPLRPRLAACTAQTGNIGLLVFDARTEELPPGALAVELALGEGAVGGRWAGLLGYESFFIVVTAGSPAERAGEGAFRDVITGKAALLPGTQIPAEVWVPLPGTAGRRLLDAWIAGEAYHPEAFLSPGTEAWLAEIGAHEGAVGVVPGAWLAETVSPVVALGAEPVLVLLEEVPRGAVREWLGCLQQGSIYSPGTP